MVPLPNDAQPFEGEKFVHVAEKSGTPGNEHGLAAGADDLRPRPQLVDEPLDNAIDHAQGAVVQARLNTLHGSVPDQLGGLAEVDQGKASRLTEEGFDGDADAGGDDATQILGPGGDYVEGDGGTQ